MRKLKLQMQITTDGFVAGPEGELDWMTWDWDTDEKLLALINSLTDSSDTILMGRKMTDGFIDYWTDALKKPESMEFDFAKKMIDTPKVVFSRSVKTSRWINTSVENNIDAIRGIKAADGNDILVYGGAEFVSSLIEADMIDEYNFFVNPTAIGHGLSIFKMRKNLKLVSSTPYEGGIVVNTYVPVRD